MVEDHAYIYVVSEPYFGGDLTTCAQRASQNGVALNQNWLAGILRQVCASFAAVRGGGTYYGFQLGEPRPTAHTSKTPMKMVI